MRLLTAIGATILAAGIGAPSAHAQALPRGLTSPVPFHLINQLVPPGLISSAPSAAPAQDLGITSLANHIARVADGHFRLTGGAQIIGRNETWQLRADQVDIFADESRLVATGNVVFTSDGGRIEAERVEFDIDAETGDFFRASLKSAPANP